MTKTSLTLIRTFALLLLALFGTSVFVAAAGGFNEGIAVHGLPGASESPLAVAVQPDGKIVIAGSTTDNTSLEEDLLLMRLNTDGSLDTSFSGDGFFSLNQAVSKEQLNAVAIQSDGKILAAGITDQGIGVDVMQLIRLNADGTLDSTFDGDGLLTPYLTGSDYAADMALQPDGKIVIAGYTIGANLNPFLVRLNPDGSVDNGFNGSGLIIVPALYRGWLSGLEIQPDGNIVAAGGIDSLTGTELFIMRVQPNGSFDLSFDGDGMSVVDLFSTDEWVESIALQPDGKIVLTGQGWGASQWELFAARLLSDGSLDTGFSGDGNYRLSKPSAGHDVLVMPDGDILLAGAPQGGALQGMLLIRLDAGGEPVAAYGSAGLRTVLVGEASGAVALADGYPNNVIVVGDTQTNYEYDVAVLRDAAAFKIYLPIVIR